MSIFSYLKNEGKSEIWGILVFAFAFLVLLSLVSFGEISYVGVFGNFLAKYLFLYFGWGSYFLPMLLLLVGLNIFRSKKIEKIHFKAVGILFFLIGICSLLGLVDSISDAGGEIGLYLSKILVEMFGYIGSYLIVATIIAISMILATSFSIINFLSSQVLGFGTYIIKKIGGFFKYLTYKQKNNDIGKYKIKIEHPLSSLPKSYSDAAKNEKKSRSNNKELINKNEGDLLSGKSLNTKESKKRYILPSLELLDTRKEICKVKKEEDLNERAFLLEKTLSDFDIKAKVVQISPGPVITRYELEPAPGVKVSRIINLSNDIALVMKSANVRILAPIPGKAAIGIEIPNRNISPVDLKEILACDEFKNAPSKLSFALGKTVSGLPYIADLSSMPHLLIAGATGSGKSICLRTIIMSILFKAKPEEVKFVLIDPKRLEMLSYEAIPHLCIPVVSKAKEATIALQNVVRLMEERYEKFAKKMVRDIESYNKLADENTLSDENEKEWYLIVVIDELADLMMVSSREVEESIIRLSQMGRAVGIHLILATQRPSVDVLTGLIKANLPARIALQVLSKTDSRVILDVNGAEDLLGKGDLLFLPPGASKAKRIQGAFVSDNETKRVIDFIKNEGEPTYDLSILKVSTVSGSDKIRKDDPLFDEAVRIILDAEQASTSFLQRRLGIGYIRAAKLMDIMEAEGIVGLQLNGNKSREILIDKDIYFNDQKG